MAALRPLLLHRMGVRQRLILHLHRDESGTSAEYKRRLGRVVERLVFCSNAQRDQWLRGVQDLRDRTVVIHNEADARLFVPKPEHESREDKTILFVGHFAETKGIHLLLDAYEILRRQERGIRLRFVARVDESASSRDPFPCSPGRWLPRTRWRFLDPF